MRVVPTERLSELYRAIAAAMGADDAEAQIYSDCFLRADLRGKDTQGIACVELFHRWLRSGAIEFGAPFTVEIDTPASAVVDGGHGPGQVVATRAMRLAVEKAKDVGVGSVFVRNTNDFAMASNYALQALEHDCVGLVMSNGIPYVAPWGGRDPLFGTSPVAFAIPASAYDPIVHDSSLSMASHGTVVRAARDGMQLPEPCLVDREGRVTADAVTFIEDPHDRNSPQLGALLSLGRKASGWLFFADVMAGILSGMTASLGVVAEPTATRRSTLGQWLLAVDLSTFGDPAQLTARVDDLIASVKASQPAEGTERVRYPGEQAAQEERRRRRDGIPVRDEHWDGMRRVAAELGLTEALSAVEGSP